MTRRETVHVGRENGAGQRGNWRRSKGWGWTYAKYLHYLRHVLGELRRRFFLGAVRLGELRRLFFRGGGGVGEGRGGRDSCG